MKELVILLCIFVSQYRICEIALFQIESLFAAVLWPIWPITNKDRVAHTWPMERKSLLSRALGLRGIVTGSGARKRTKTRCA